MLRVRLADGRTLCAECDGDGPPLLLVHGFTGGRDAWPATLRDGLARTARVIAVDLPGHGRSDPAPDPKRFALPALIDDLCAVLDACDVGAALWVGYSMGGRIALAAAFERPERVAALALEGASPGLREAEERRARRRSDEALAQRLDERGLEWFVDHWMGLPLFASQRTLGPERLAAERRRRLANDAASLAACLRGASVGAQTSYWDRLAQLDVPALLVAGEQDARYCALAQEMADAIPEARVQSVAGCGHAAHLEDPDAWVRTIGAFARGIDFEGDPP